MKNKRIYKYLFISVFLFLSIVFLGLFGIVVAQKVIPHDYQIKLVQEYPKLMSYVRITKITDIFDFYAYFQKNNLPDYYLDISQKNLDKLIENPKDYVKAKFIYNDKIYEVKVKHKGFDQKHLTFEKKSWAVSFDKNNQFLEKYSKISFVIPSDRRFLVEQLNMYRAKKMGLMRLDTWFGELNVNGKNEGIYFINQSFDQNFLALNQKYDQANLYSADLDYYGKVYKDLNKWDKYVSEETSQVSNESDVYLLLEILKQNNQDFTKNIFSIVDKDIFFKWAVHSLMMQSKQQNYVHNIRAYFDPTKAKFEFIPWDVLIFSPREDIDSDYNPLLTRILLIPEFLHQRNIYLWNYVKDNKNIKDDLNYYDKLREETLVAFKQDRVKLFSNRAVENYIEMYRNFIIQIFDYNRKAFDYVESWAMIHSGIKNENPNVLNIMEFQIEAFSAHTFKELSFVSSYKSEQKYNLIIDINNNQKLDSEDKLISQSSYNKEKNMYYFQDVDYLFHTNRIIPNYQPLNSQDEHFKLDKTRYRLFITGENDTQTLSDFKLKIENFFTKKNIKPDIKYVYDKLFEDFDKIYQSPEDFINLNGDYFYFDGTNIKIKKDSIINRDLIIPENVTLIIDPGTRLQFYKQKSLISYGKIFAEGTKENPIIINSFEKDNPWGVFALIGEKSNGSKFSYISVDNGSQTKINGVFFSGQFDAHFSDIEIKNSMFTNANGDDSINIKNAKVNISSSYFGTNKFDAIDLDFNTEGIIQNCVFENNGNDSIDLGGAKNITLLSNLIISSGDKGISIGENSQDIKVINNTIVSSNIGIAIKDLSDPIIINNTLVKNNFGISSYEKKGIFGEGYGKVYNTLIYNNKKNLDISKTGKTEIDKNSNLIDNINLEFIDPSNYNFLLKSEKEGNSEILNKIILQNFTKIPVGIFKNSTYQLPF